MFFSDVSTQLLPKESGGKNILETAPSQNSTAQRQDNEFIVRRFMGSPLLKQLSRLHLLTWICLLLACGGASWFSYQYFLLPQPARFTPDWGAAQWVQAGDGHAPVAYFRYETGLNVLPDGAFVTVAASQVFRLYVNGTFIGSNSLDFVQGNFPRAYMYDVASFLQLGSNVVALRVANVDRHLPTVRVSFGLIQGTFVYAHGTGKGWVATAQSNAAHPRYATNVSAWTKIGFDASSWIPVQQAASPSASPMLTVNPLIYERPIALAQWMSAGGSHQANFVHQFSLPAGITGAWLRLVATGTAHVFINGNLFILWNSQPPTLQQNLADYLSDNETLVPYRTGLALGVYDITSFLHPGNNTLAVYVTTPGVSASQVGLDTLSSALSTDMLISDMQGHSSWLLSDQNWHASQQAVAGWTQGAGAALSWSRPVLVGRPGASRTFYLPDSSTYRTAQFLPPLLVWEAILMSSVAVLAFWLLMSLLVMRRYYRSRSNALETMSLAYLPAVACEALLVVLSRESQLPQPFPYTWQCACLLLLLVGLSYVFLWRNAEKARKQLAGIPVFAGNGSVILASTKSAMLAIQSTLKLASIQSTSRYRVRSRLLKWGRVHWAIIPIILLAIPLICYNLPYEPYWQDELTSYYAAKGILAHGLPLLPSGFLYPKGELYSYVLAASMFIFGEQGGTLRFVSIMEYLLSLPLLYGIGCYFFERRVALLATAMLALSPISLIWGRQVRMYEQAQVLTLLVVFLFYKALKERHRIRLVYLTLICLLATYLSHEETFIILPAIVLYGLGTWLAERIQETRRRQAQGLLHGRPQGSPLACPPGRTPYTQDADKQSSEHLPSADDNTGDGARQSNRGGTFNKHWWFAVAIGASIIALQLIVVRVTHPDLLGTDQSQRPLIQLTFDNIPYYFDVLFFPNVLGHGTLPWITLNSFLAVAGCIWALRSPSSRARYCALFLLISFITLVLAFTLASDRYLYPVLSLYYLLGAYALLLGMRTLWRFARSRVVLQQPGRGTKPAEGGHLSRPIRVLAVLTLSIVCASVLFAPILPISGYNLFISQQAGFSYHRHYADYDAAGQYMQQHWRKGDIVISVSPAISILYYVGHVDYFFSVNRALYLFERNNHIVDTPTGSMALLNQQDLLAVISTHARIWIISDNGLYQSEVTKDNRFVFPSDFHVVFEGYGSAIYFRG